MKSLKTLTIILSLAAAYTTILNAQTLSPRAEANKTRVAAGSTEDLARNAALGSPRAEANKTRIVTRSGPEGDTLAATRNSRLSPRATLQREGSGFEIAPLANKAGKSCEAPCCKK